MDYQIDTDIIQNTQDPYTLQLNSKFQNTPMTQESLNNNNLQTKKLEIPFSKQKLNIFFFIFLIISSLIYSISVISIKTIYGPFFFIIEFLVFLYFENNKIVIIKDEIQNKIYIQVINYLSIKRNKFEFDLDNIHLNVVYFYTKYLFLIVNNFKNGAENDFNTPFQIYFYENINLDKFEGQYQLNKILNDFLINQENPLNYNANSDVNNQENNINESNYNEYLAINKHFYIYYNKYPLFNKYCEKCCLKCFTFVIHSFLIILGLCLLLELDDEFKDGKEAMHLGLFIGYFSFYFVGSLHGFCICKKIDSNLNKLFLRIDIKFSINFDKIFLASLSPDRNTYNTTSEFNFNEIIRFFLEQNNNGYDLKVVLIRGIIRNICYIDDQKLGLQGLLNIINQKIVNNRNDINAEHQALNECPPPLAISQH